MKTSFFLTAFCIVALSIFLLWEKSGINHNGLDISVNESNTNYKFTAYYNSENTAKVEHYINKCIAPNSLAKSENDYMDVNTTLSDQTKFYIKEGPGELKIELDRTRNTAASYFRIKNICMGVKDLLMGK